jgi:hypothetical protein
MQTYVEGYLHLFRVSLRPLYLYCALIIVEDLTHVNHHNTIGIFNVHHTTTQSAVPNVYHPKLDRHNTSAFPNVHYNNTIGSAQCSSPKTELPQHNCNWHFSTFVATTQLVVLNVHHPNNSPATDSSPHVEGQSVPCFKIDKDHPAVRRQWHTCLFYCQTI